MYEDKHYENPQLYTLERFMEKREQDRFATCMRLIPDDVSSLLDVGCGNGAFMAFLEQRHTPITLLGVERAETARHSAVCKARIQSGSIENLPFDDHAFDLISAMEIIEHIPYSTYEKALDELERVASDYILLSVPYREKRHNVRCPYCGCQFNVNYHMRSFDEDILTGLFKSFQLARLAIVEVDDYVFAPTLRAIYRIISSNRELTSTALCPQCGFSGTISESSTKTTTAARTRGWLRDTFKSKLPTYKRPTWIVTLYERSQ